jgi:hypothetical protein
MHNDVDVKPGPDLELPFAVHSIHLDPNGVGKGGAIKYDQVALVKLVCYGRWATGIVDSKSQRNRRDSRIQSQMERPR